MFEDFSKKLSVFGREMVKKTGEVAELASLKTKTLAKKKKIQDEMLALGRAYYEEHKDEIVEFEDKITAINTMYTELECLEEEYRLLKEKLPEEEDIFEEEDMPDATETAEKTTEESTTESVEDAAEESAEEATEEPADETTDETTEESVAESVEEAIEESGDSEEEKEEL